MLIESKLYQVVIDFLFAVDIIIARDPLKMRLVLSRSLDNRNLSNGCGYFLMIKKVMSKIKNNKTKFSLISITPF